MLTQAPHRTDSQHLSHAESRVGKELNACPSLQITAATLNTHPGFLPERHRTANSDSQHDRPNWERCWQQHISQHCQAVSTEQLPEPCTPLHPWDCHLWLLKRLSFVSHVRMVLFYLILWGRRRFHTPKEYSEDNYNVCSTNTGKGRIISEIQTLACVFSRSKLPFGLERFTRLNTQKNCNNLQTTQILFVQSALPSTSQRKEKKNMGF